MILDQILATKRREVAEARAESSEDDLRERAALAPPPRDFLGALRRDPGLPINVIAEIKRASPSAGPIRPGIDPGSIAIEYAAAGAAAISVLTDSQYFDGDLLHLVAARARVGIPVLRKDFVIDRWQVLEARAAGADAVLLIVSALDDATLRSLLADSRALGMEPLVEIHDPDEARRAADAGARIIGVNHRDLRTFTMDFTLFEKIRPLLPKGAVSIAESGIKTPADLRRMSDAGADGILVGEVLMRHPSPGAALRELLA